MKLEFDMQAAIGASNALAEEFGPFAGIAADLLFISNIVRLNMPDGGMAVAEMLAKTAAEVVNHGGLELPSSVSVAAKVMRVMMGAPAEAATAEGA